MAAVKGVRSIEMDVANVERATAFYTRVWNLTEVARSSSGSVYLRGTARSHRILALHRAPGVPAFRRMVFDGGDRENVTVLHEQVVKSLGRSVPAPAALSWPGGGWGFAFKDPEARNIAVVCDVADHAEGADVADHPRKIAHVNVNSADHAAVIAHPSLPADQAAAGTRTARKLARGLRPARRPVATMERRSA
jgi:predicted enzyme related to lactoylglutathione lyase